MEFVDKEKNLEKLQPLPQAALDQTQHFLCIFHNKGFQVKEGDSDNVPDVSFFL